MQDPLDLSTGRGRAQGSARRVKSRRSMSLAAAVIAAGVMGGGAFFASRSLTSMRPVASETRALAEAAQQRAQFQDGKRLLDRIGGTAAAAPAPARPAVESVAAIAPMPKSAPPPVTTVAKAAPLVVPPSTVPEAKTAAAAPEQPGMFREVWDILTLKAPPAAPQPPQKASPPAVAQPAPAKTEPPKFAALAPMPPVPAPVLAAPLVFVLRPFDTTALARFRDGERDRSLAALPDPMPMPTPIQIPMPKQMPSTPPFAPPVAVAPQPAPSPPVAASGTPPPSFGSVDPVPMAAEVTHKSGRQGLIACATIIEQAQIGELSAEDRLILQQRRCR